MKLTAVFVTLYLAASIVAASGYVIALNTPRSRRGFEFSALKLFVTKYDAALEELRQLRSTLLYLKQKLVPQENNTFSTLTRLEHLTYSEWGITRNLLWKLCRPNLLPMCTEDYTESCPEKIRDEVNYTMESLFPVFPPPQSFHIFQTTWRQKKKLSFVERHLDSYGGLDVQPDDQIADFLVAIENVTSDAEWQLDQLQIYVSSISSYQDRQLDEMIRDQFERQGRHSTSLLNRFSRRKRHAEQDVRWLMERYAVEMEIPDCDNPMKTIADCFNKMAEMEACTPLFQSLCPNYDTNRVEFNQVLKNTYLRYKATTQWISLSSTFNSTIVETAWVGNFKLTFGQFIYIYSIDGASIDGELQIVFGMKDPLAPTFQIRTTFETLEEDLVNEVLRLMKFGLYGMADVPTLTY